ncbi:MAG: peptidylprolyl isomerase, partial [Desulfatitalea sp.]|nr:peptidylprolyl isomerase [Desulfatitalea sp.]
AAGVAHEINNPAGFVSSNLHTLAEYHDDLQTAITAFGARRAQLEDPEIVATLPAELRQRIADLAAMEETLDLNYIMTDMGSLIAETREGTDRIRRIVADLKAAIHPGQETKVVTDLHAVIDSAVNLVRHDTQHRIEIRREYGTLPAMATYAQRLNQLYLNLLVNATQAITGQGTITIRTGIEEHQAVVSITDSGSGIAPEHLNKIFDPFFTTKPVGAGTGLGLKVAYDIAHNHGGTITAESAAGAGTTFTVRLPLGEVLEAIGEDQV